MAGDRNGGPLPGEDIGGSMGSRDVTDGYGRGYTPVADPDLPPKTITIGGDSPVVPGRGQGRMTIPNYERQVYDPDTESYVDKYRDGFLPRDPSHPNER